MTIYGLDNASSFILAPRGGIATLTTANPTSIAGAIPKTDSNYSERVAQTHPVTAEMFRAGLGLRVGSMEPQELPKLLEDKNNRAELQELIQRAIAFLEKNASVIAASVSKRYPNVLQESAKSLAQLIEQSLRQMEIRDLETLRKLLEDNNNPAELTGVAQELIQRAEGLLEKNAPILGASASTGYPTLGRIAIGSTEAAMKETLESKSLQESAKSLAQLIEQSLRQMEIRDLETLFIAALGKNSTGEAMRINAEIQALKAQR